MQAIFLLRKLGAALSIGSWALGGANSIIGRAGGVVTCGDRHVESAITVSFPGSNAFVVTRKMQPNRERSPNVVGHSFCTVRLHVHPIGGTGKPLSAAS